MVVCLWEDGKAGGRARIEAAGKKLTIPHNVHLPLLRHQKMKTIDFKSFNQFESWIEGIKSEQSIEKINNPWLFSEMLFRGQADEKWGLLTTLERDYPEVDTIEDYLRIAASIKLQVELHTGKKWGDIIDKDGQVIDGGNIGFGWTLPALEYLVYLRHHGFPSPLLDWTRSPYIAALFAYSGCDAGDGKVAIFMFQQYSGNSVSRNHDDAFIHAIGPYIDTHKRHSIQQAEYSLCLKKTGTRFNKEFTLYPHENYRASSPKELYKITLPQNEKYKILAKLDQFNLNLHSLYGSEEALMATLALREFHLK